MASDDTLEVVANDVQIEVDTLRCFHLDRIFDGHVQLFAYFASLKRKIKMMSVNQISVYHTLLEAYNIMSHSSFEQIHKK